MRRPRREFVPDVLSSLLGLASFAGDAPGSRGETPTRRSTRAAGRRAEWRAVVHYCLRGYRVLGRNVWAGRYEIDLIVRRGNRLVFCEVKSKTSEGHGDPLEMVGPEKLARMQQAATTWLAAHPELDSLEMSFEVVAARGRRLERVVVTL